MLAIIRTEALRGLSRSESLRVSDSGSGDNWINKKKRPRKALFLHADDYFSGRPNDPWKAISSIGRRGEGTSRSRMPSGRFSFGPW